MVDSIDVVANAQALAAEYNNLRSDVLDCRELWVPCTAGTQGPGATGDFVTFLLGALNNKAYMTFQVPTGFASIVAAEVIVIPTVTEANSNWDIDTDYGAEGEAYNIHSEADAARVYNTVANQLFAIDISGELSAIVAGDYVGVRINLGDAADIVYIIGLRFRYL